MSSSNENLEHVLLKGCAESYTLWEGDRVVCSGIETIGSAVEQAEKMIASGYSEKLDVWLFESNPLMGTHVKTITRDGD